MILGKLATEENYLKGLAGSPATALVDKQCNLNRRGFFLLIWFRLYQLNSLAETL